MKPPADDQVRVILLPREDGFALTPEGDAALDRAIAARSVADEATRLARHRKDHPITGDPLELL